MNKQESEGCQATPPGGKSYGSPAAGFLWCRQGPYPGHQGLIRASRFDSGILGILEANLALTRHFMVALLIPVWRWTAHGIKSVQMLRLHN